MTFQIKDTIEKPFDQKDINAGGIELTIILDKSNSMLSGKLILKEIFPKNVSRGNNEFELNIKNLSVFIGIMNLATVKLTKIKSIMQELNEK